MPRQRPLTDKQKRFAMLVAGGRSLVESYQLAYDARRMKASSIKVEASRLARKPHIARGIKQLRKARTPDELVEKALDDDWVIENLQSLVVSDFSNSQTKLGALEQLLRIQKMVK